MTFVARIAICTAFLFVVSSQANAFEWPHPFGHDVEGSFGSRITPFGSLDVLGDFSNREDDGDETSRGGLIDLRAGANLAITDRLSITGEVRTGDDHRSAYVGFGGGNFDQNFDVSISQLYVNWDVPTRLGLADNVALAVGRQRPSLTQNDIYNGTLLDEDVNLDGIQLDWDCGCEECGIEYGGGIGGWKLSRGMTPISGPTFNDFNTQDYETETARLLTADLHANWAINETTRLQPYLNYFRYTNSDDGFNGNQETQAGIVDSPDILQAGINTSFGVGGVNVILTGEYIHNLDADHDEDGYTAGIGFDIEACDRPHRFSYLYQNIGAWSVVPGLVQDDHRDARTAYKGHVVQGEWNTTDRVRLYIESYIADTDSDSQFDSDAWRIFSGARIQFN